MRLRLFPYPKFFLTFLCKDENVNYKNFPISKINIGTTIGTNTLLERKGAKILFCVTKGFKDNFVIGNQKRTNLFSRHHKRGKPLYLEVIEVEERISKTGRIINKLNCNNIRNILKKKYNLGFNALSIALINSFKFPKHEILIKTIAERIGFKFITCSNEVSPTINYTSRGYTTLADNYLNPKILSFTKKIITS